MDSKVDKFFKDKLETSNLQPSVQAWEKVEAHLAKKNRIALWLKVAAVLAFFALATTIAVRYNNAGQQPTEISQQQTPVVEPAPAPVVNNDVTYTASNKASKQIVKAPRKATQQVEERDVPAEVVQQQLEVIVETLVAVEEITLTAQAPQTEAVVEKEKPVVIVYSLPSVAKKAKADELTEEKKTGFQKVIEVAMEVKNSDNPFGELRQAKDDLFALDFKRDKDKTKKQ